MASHRRIRRTFLVFKGGGFLPCRGSKAGNAGEGIGLYSSNCLTDRLVCDKLDSGFGGLALLETSISFLTRRCSGFIQAETTLVVGGQAALDGRPWTAFHPAFLCRVLLYDDVVALEQNYYPLVAENTEIEVQAPGYAMQNRSEEKRRDQETQRARNALTTSADRKRSHCRSAVLVTLETSKNCEMGYLNRDESGRKRKLEWPVVLL